MKASTLSKKLAYVKNHYPDKFLEIVEKSGIVEPLINNSINWDEEQTFLAYSFLFPIPYFTEAESDYVTTYFYLYPLKKDLAIDYAKKGCPYPLALWILKFKPELIDEISHYPEENFICENADVNAFLNLLDFFGKYCDCLIEDSMEKMYEAIEEAQSYASNVKEYLTTLEDEFNEIWGEASFDLFHCFESKYYLLGKFVKEDVESGRIKNLLSILEHGVEE